MHIFSHLTGTTVPGFKVLDEELVPEGLNPHTRSICWLAEQVIIQNLRLNKNGYGVNDVISPDSDIAPWDSALRIAGMQDIVYVNIKVSDIAKPRRRNDIASVKALLRFYRDNPGALLFFVVIKLGFENCYIRFYPGVISRAYPSIAEYVINRRNGHLQSYYDCAERDVSNLSFCREVASRALQAGYRLEPDLIDWLH